MVNIEHATAPVTRATGHCPEIVCIQISDRKMSRRSIRDVAQTRDSRRLAATPAGVEAFWIFSGGVAPLNHRLMAAMPPA